MANSRLTDTQTGPLEFVENPGLAEVFVDRLAGSTFQHDLLRLEFQVVRFEGLRNETPKMRAYPCARLVLTPHAMLELQQRLNQLIADLAAAGVVKVFQKPDPSGLKQ